MWKKIMINATQIEFATEKAVKIKLPNNSGYKDYTFWHPAKLVSKKGGMYTFSYTDDFKFRLIKYGKGQYNRSAVLSEVEISAEEIKTIYES